MAAPAHYLAGEAERKAISRAEQLVEPLKKRIRDLEKDVKRLQEDSHKPYDFSALVRRLEALEAK